MPKKGYKQTEEHRRKISDATKGRLSSYGMLGKKQTEESKVKMSIAKKGKKPHLFTQETREKMRQNMTGKIKENAPNWRGGTSTVDLILRGSPKYKKWRDIVLKRDYFICQQCGNKNNLEVHHIKSWVKNLNLRFEISNGITLCKKCHPRKKIEIFNFNLQKCLH